MLRCDYCAYLSLYECMPVCMFFYMCVSTRYMQSDLTTSINKPLLSYCQALRTAAVTMVIMYREDYLPYLYVLKHGFLQFWHLQLIYVKVSLAVYSYCCLFVLCRLV